MEVTVVANSDKAAVFELAVYLAMILSPETSLHRYPDNPVG